jgi:uncharacterized Rmd1/YagE family protein
MRCVAICVAKEYRLYGVANFFRKQKYTIKLYDKVLYVTNGDKTHHIFVFPYGCVVIWGLKQLEEQQIIKHLQPFTNDPLSVEIYERFVFRQNQKEHKTDVIAYRRFNMNIITLESKEPLIKLALSFGLAQSVKLRYYEEYVQKTVDQSAYLSEELYQKGKIKLSNSEISKRVGEIFAIRSSISLSSVYLEPEYLLEHLDITHYYELIRKFLRVSQRVDILNRKLKVLHGLFEMLTGQLQYRLGTFLKLIATALVVMQVFIGFLQLVG